MSLVLTLAKLEQRAAHVEAAQLAPVVDHERPSVEEAFDSFFRIGLCAVREIRDRRDRSVVKRDRHHCDIVDEFTAARGRRHHVHARDRSTDK